jgi:hypothetical protein
MTRLCRCCWSISATSWKRGPASKDAGPSLRTLQNLRPDQGRSTYRQSLGEFQKLVFGVGRGGRIRDPNCNFMSERTTRCPAPEAAEKFRYALASDTIGYERNNRTPSSVACRAIIWSPAVLKVAFPDSTASMTSWTFSHMQSLQLQSMTLSSASRRIRSIMRRLGRLAFEQRD